jgi:LysR family glycine cleavage system transcriptional activator
MRTLPHVTWLRTFEAASRHGSFTAAADELRLTPAAVSQQIKLLEETLEVKLFKRLPKGVKLTDIGQAYAKPVRASFVGLQTATEALFQPKRKTTLRVRASVSFGALVLASRLAEFQALHPEIDIVLSTTVWADRMSDATVDVDIRYGAGDWPEENIWSLGDGKASLVCNPADAVHLQSEPALLKDADIVPIIGSENDWALMFQKLGLECPLPAPWMPVDSSILALEVIASGRGMAIVNIMFSRSYINRGLLVEPFSTTLETRNNFYIVARVDQNKQPHIAKFHEWLATIIV